MPLRKLRRTAEEERVHLSADKEKTMKEHPCRSILCVSLLLSSFMLFSTSSFALPNNVCTVSRDVPGGPFVITPPGCTYDGPEDLHHGQGTHDLKWDPTHGQFANIQIDPGGLFEGTIDTFTSVFTIDLTGIGELEGYHHTLTIPAHCEAHAGPWDAAAEVISFDTEMVRIEGQLEDDPHFESLRIVAGSEFGYPSPGHTTVTSQDGRTYVVDSMFNIGFRIDFVGAADGPLAGLGGSFEGRAVMKAYANPEGSNPEPGDSTTPDSP